MFIPEILSVPVFTALGSGAVPWPTGRHRFGAGELGFRSAVPSHDYAPYRNSSRPDLHSE
jgi:hypothetical protein